MYYQLTYSNHKMQLKITSTDSLEWETHSKLASTPKEKNYAWNYFFLHGKRTINIGISFYTCNDVFQLPSPIKQ